MAGFIKNILKISLIALFVPSVVFGAQQPNPRGSSVARSATRSADTASNAAVRRSATSVIARSTGANKRQNRAVVVARPATARTAAVRSVRSVVTGANVARAASKSSFVRSGLKQKTGNANLARASVARATAVFNDVSKIGGGYASCRDAYATCMDQLCANANDTYRRCFCSDRFTDFRDTSDKLDEALKMLAEFQDTNLNAVDKTAAEVNAMYTATAGEQAIKRDTSASQKLLDDIAEVLSGKKTSSTKTQSSAVSTTTSLGVLDLSGFSTSNDDVFGGSSVFNTSSPVFGSPSSYTDISALEGKDLYDAALQQCSQITRESCGGDAMFNLARSAYSILVTQDCNLYEKNINAKKASVEETVRTAEKYLREARLNEYRAHNSADVNECLTRVESAMRQPVACGENYERCMDTTGLYINTATGEPIYSQALFGLNSLIVLDGGSDVLGANPTFNTWLDEKKMFATSALDSCRDLADIVWYEYKRSAIIQIAQAQDEKIQQVKDNCVATIKECYDKQTGDLKSIDTTKMQGTDAISATAARGMCYDRVQACAALYGDPNGCKYDDANKKLTNADGKKCGLQSLLTYVDTVDSVKVAEGCDSVLRKYAHEICPDSTVTVGTGTYDPKDSTKELTEEKTIAYGKCAGVDKNQLRAALDNRRRLFCVNDLINNDTSRTIGDVDEKTGEIASAFNTNIMNTVIKDIYDSLHIAFTSGCEDFGGTWVSKADNGNGLAPDVNTLVQEFYTTYYGVKVTDKNVATKNNIVSYSSDPSIRDTDGNIVDNGSWVEGLDGWCVSADIYQTCQDNGGIFNDNGTCTLPTEWYMDTCTDWLGGKWEGEMCRIENLTQDTIPGWEKSSFRSN